ncbi:MAG: orotidine-5'-phosphate decarboxylase [Patescibacteria group bacterium]|jgi:orotidine-5'-phosphate decarboxylase
MEARKRVIVALDVDNLEEAEAHVRDLASYVGSFKVGLELLTAVGAPKVVECIHALRGQVFFDGKFSDIPNTIAGAARVVAGLNVKMFDVHASAGVEAMMAAVDNRGSSLVFAVTVLTSLEENTAQLIFGGTTKAKVLQMARDAKIAGCDGIICSPQELRFLRAPRTRWPFENHARYPSRMGGGRRPEADHDSRGSGEGRCVVCRDRAPDHKTTAGNRDSHPGGKTHRRRNRFGALSRKKQLGSCDTCQKMTKSLFSFTKKRIFITQNFLSFPVITFILDGSTLT